MNKLAISAVALMLIGMAGAAEARDGCARHGPVTKCTFERTVEPGERRDLKEIGPFTVFIKYFLAEDCEPNEPGCQTSDRCRIVAELDEDLVSSNFGSLVVVSTASDFRHAYGGGFHTLSPDGDVIQIEEVAGSFEPGESCWGAVRFKYARSVKILFRN